MGFVPAMGCQWNASGDFCGFIVELSCFERVMQFDFTLTTSRSTSIGSFTLIGQLTRWSLRRFICVSSVSSVSSSPPQILSA